MFQSEREGECSKVKEKVREGVFERESEREGECPKVRGRVSV